MKNNIIVIVLLAILFLGGMFAAGHLGLIRLKPLSKASATCSGDDGHDHGKLKEKIVDQHSHEKENSNVVSCKEDEIPVQLTAEQKKLIKIEVSEAAAGTFENLLHLNGEFKLNMDQTARIMPRMPGFVTKVAVSEGEKVKRGQLLAKLTSHKLGEYYSDLNSSAEREALALSEFKMAKQLKASNAMSQKEYLRCKREYADAQIARRRAEALLKSLRLDPAHRGHSHEYSQDNAICTEYEIRAPFDGTVIAKDITVGENFAEDNTKVVFVVSNLAELWLDLQADDAKLRVLRKSMNVAVSPVGSPKHYAGRIIYIAPVIDKTTRNGLVRVQLDNAAGELRPGEFGTGLIRLAASGMSVLVPREAVQLVSGENVVFVPQGKGFTPKVVSVCKTEQGITQIISGLRPTDKYVSSGAFELKSILLTSGMDPHAGHGH